MWTPHTTHALAVPQRSMWPVTLQIGRGNGAQHQSGEPGALGGGCETGVNVVARTRLTGLQMKSPEA